MADNVPITAGSGTSIRTDDVSGVHYQGFKLYSSEADSAEPIGDTDYGSSRALWVAPKADLVYPTTPVNSAGLTTVTTTYTIGDVLGNGWTIPNAAVASGGFLYVEALQLFDIADVVGVINLYFAQESITFGTDNTAPSVSDADAVKLIGKQVVYMEDLGGARAGFLDSFAMRCVANGSTNLYVYATTGTANAVFGSATDLKLRVATNRN